MDGDNGAFSLGGYVRTVSGVQSYRRLELSPLLLPDPVVGQNVGIGRLEWSADVGQRVTLDLHQRVLFRVQNQDLPSFGATTAGVGVTAAPSQNIDMRSVILDRDGLYAEHDIDRLTARIFLDQASLYVGRQAIAWGNTMLFSVSDIWTKFSPFEIDTERRGIDAIRAIIAPSLSWELDVVVADRGPLEDLGAGARFTFYRPRGDVFVGVAKSWQEVLFMGGFARDLDTVTLRLDAMLPVEWDVPGQDAGFAAPRATVGVDHFRDDWTLSAEYHFNGAGENDAADYADNVVNTPAFGRGEVYLMGTHYVGALASYKLTELATLSLAATMNLLDPSALIAPSFGWQLAQDVDLSFGAYVPVGAVPDSSGLVPSIQSEFGSAPLFVFGQLAAYY